MQNKVYYGEYTLKHWIDLILTRKIILPGYQRFFVWDMKKSKTLIEALKDNQFVPPVTIGCYSENGEKQNLILDGQQRLTSILLAYFGIFPQKKDSKLDNKFANENDDKDENDDMDFIEWNFNELIDKVINGSHDKMKIHKNAIDAGYSELIFTMEEKDFENCYLGFSFIVPKVDDGKEQQKFYSKVFRSINIEGKALLPLESREALYYLNKDLVSLFKPEFSNKIKVKINNSKMDFVRYLSMTAQFYKCNNKDVIAKGYSRNMEKYYEEFIYTVVGEEENEEFTKISDKIDRIKNVEKTLDDMKLIRQDYESIIDLDLYMFGIVYCTLFENKAINADKINEFVDEIEMAISNFKSDTAHTRNPSALKYLRTRIEKSIKICEVYFL